MKKFWNIVGNIIGGICLIVFIVCMFLYYFCCTDYYGVPIP